MDKEKKVKLVSHLGPGFRLQVMESQMGKQSKHEMATGGRCRVQRFNSWVLGFGLARMSSEAGMARTQSHFKRIVLCDMLMRNGGWSHNTFTHAMPS